MATPLSVDLPAPTGVIAEYFGPSGGSTAYYYYVQAIYPGGRSLLNSSNLITTFASLSSTSRILVQWNAMSGAIGYNVYRAATTTIPTIGTNFMASVTSNAFTDDGTLAIAAGTVVIDGIRYARALYDFAVDGGGAPGLITPAQSDTIPLGAALIGGGYIKVLTDLAGATNVGFGTSAGSSTTALIASTAIATLNTGTVSKWTPTVPTNIAPVIMSAAGTITLTSTVAALTAGKVEVFQPYVMPL